MPAITRSLKKKKKSLTWGWVWKRHGTKPVFLSVSLLTEVNRTFSAMQRSFPSGLFCAREPCQAVVTQEQKINLVCFQNKSNYIFKIKCHTWKVWSYCVWVRCAWQHLNRMRSSRAWTHNKGAVVGLLFCLEMQINWIEFMQFKHQLFITVKYEDSILYTTD